MLADRLPNTLSSKEQIRNIFTELNDLVGNLAALCKVFFTNYTDPVDDSDSFPSEDILRLTATLFNCIPDLDLRDKLESGVVQAVGYHDINTHGYDTDTKHNTFTPHDSDDDKLVFKSDDEEQSNDDDDDDDNNEVEEDEDQTVQTVDKESDSDDDDL